MIWIGHRLGGTLEEEVSAPAFEQFASESEFRAYMSNQETSGFGRQPIGVDIETEMMPAELSFDSGAKPVERYSESNVQVKGIDEPDIVKTDGNYLYTSQEGLMAYERAMPMGVTEPMIGIMPPDRQAYAPTTDVISALPVSGMKKADSVPAQGNLLVTGQRMIVFEYNKVTGFDISNKTDVQQKWQHELEGSQQIETARLIEDKLLLITKTGAYQGSPCPVPLWTGKDPRVIPCTSIWRPDESIPSDSLYTLNLIDPNSGDIINTISFVGSLSQTTIYVSPAFAYLTFSKNAS